MARERRNPYPRNRQAPPEPVVQSLPKFRPRVSAFVLRVEEAKDQLLRGVDIAELMPLHGRIVLDQARWELESDAGAGAETPPDITPGELVCITEWAQRNLQARPTMSKRLLVLIARYESLLAEKGKTAC